MSSTAKKNTNAPPLISVGMPVYNGERFISLAIESVLAQSLADFELIISDNASTDSTEDICKRYANSDSRIRYFRNQDNIGAASNYNRLFALARGRFFRWFNSDDIMSPDLHQKCLAALQSNPEAVLAYGRTRLIDDSGEDLELYDDNMDLQQSSPSERFKSFFERAGFTNAIYGLMRTDAMRSTRLFGDGSLPAADIAFMAEMTLLGKFIEIPEILFYRRIHADASSYDRSDHEKQQRFWRAAPKPFRLPVLRQSGRYLISAWTSGLAMTDRLTVSAHILRQMYWQRSEILSDFANMLRSNFRQ